MTVQPELLTLMLVCLQDGFALSFPALNYARISPTGGNVTTRSSKSLISEIVTDRSKLEIQTIAATTAESEGLHTLTRNTFRFESRVGFPVRPQGTFPAIQRHRNDYFGRHSVTESHRRPEFYIPPSGKQSGRRPSGSHTLQLKRPSSSHQFAERNTFYEQPGSYQTKLVAGVHQIAPRIYPYKLGPDKLKSTPDMHAHTYGVSGGKPPQSMSSNTDETSEAKQSPGKMPMSGEMADDYMDTEPYHDTGVYKHHDHDTGVYKSHEHDTGVYKPHDYHYDHSYDSYKDVHLTELTEKPTTTIPPPPPSPPVVGHYRIGFKLFYIPLYAGIVFVFYLLVLIIRSISRHKGQVPYDFLTNPPARMLRDDIAERVIRALETARKRYNTGHK